MAEKRKKKSAGSRGYTEKVTGAQRDILRAKRREERRRKVRRQKIMLTAGTAVFLVLVVAAVVSFMPSLRLSRALAKGSEYVQAADYVSAQAEYEKALDIDSTSVMAYRGLAENYLAQKDAAAAESNLYLGWENTQDESLLNYYCTVVLNEAVAEINEKKVTLETLDKCIQILEINSENSDALSLADTAYQRFFAQMEGGQSRMFCDTTGSKEDSYEAYEKLVRRLLQVYQTSQSEEVKVLLQKYALADTEWMWMDIANADSYCALLQEVYSAAGEEELIGEALSCLAAVQEQEAYFAEAFEEFDAGHYEYGRELVSSDSYQQLRDSFIEEESGCWEGSVYIPVNRDRFVLHRTEDGMTFFFPDASQDEAARGIITIWGSRQADDGVQRSVISYEPSGESADGQHTEYTIQYLYSNVKIDGQYVPQMNYRFDTKVTNAEGEAVATTAIGDWGGEHEWEIDY